MIKEYKKTIILTSMIILIPMIVGLFLWNRLPDQVATHFSMDGSADRWGSKQFAVIGMPLLMLVLHWFCILGTASDPKRKNIGGKMIYVVLWIIPVISLFCNLATYASVLGYDVDMGSIVFFVVGIGFIITGNYLPKSGQSYTVGIKIPWTLHSEENWNRTHRLAGWLWMICGLLFAANALLKFNWMVLAVVPMIVVPAVYSFALYKKGI